MLRLLTCAALLAVAARPPLAQQSPPTLVLTGATVIDGTGAPPSPGMTLVIESGRITQLYRTGTRTTPPNATVRDLRGRYVIPGLIDAHVHVGMGHRENGTLARLLKGGVTTVRNMVGNCAVLGALARQAASGEIESPDIYYSFVVGGAAMSDDPRSARRAGRGGAAAENPCGRRVRDSLDPAALVSAANAQGVNGFKLYADITADQTTLLAAEAHRQNLPVWAHATLFPARPSDLVRAGVDVLSHAAYLIWESVDSLPSYRQRARMAPFAGTRPDHPSIDRVLRAMAERGVVLDATLHFFHAHAARTTPAPNPDFQLGRDTLAAAARWADAVTRRARDLGVLVSAGTDGHGAESEGALPNLHAELELLVDSAGFPPLEAIRSATSIAARTMRLEQSIGTIAPGMQADLVVLRSDPVERISNTRDIEFVVKRGRVIERRPTPASPQNQAGQLSEASQGAVRYERTECWAQIGNTAKELGLECGWLTVPEMRERPNGPVVRLAVTRYRAPKPSGAPPVFDLHGGPGGNGSISITSADAYRQMSGEGQRDVVLFDQRAVGLSEPKLCREESIEQAQDDSSLAPAQRWNEHARRCVASIRAQGRDPLGYTTPVAAEDVRDLRRALGYEKFELFGASYGGRLAFEVMRRDSAAVHAVVVVNASVPALAFATEGPIIVQRAIERLFGACAAQAECQRTFPTLEQDFYAVHDSLSRAPLEVRLDRGSGVTTMNFDGRAFLRSVRCQLTNSRKLARIPLVVRELRRGDRVGAATMLAQDCLIADPGTRLGVQTKNYLVTCYEAHGQAFWDARAAVRARAKPIFLQFEQGGEECSIWQARFADSTDLAPVRSDVPTLILGGEFDERSPVDLARRAAAGLTRKYIYEIPGASHGMPYTGCVLEIMRSFAADPLREPDASCIARMPKVAFALDRLTQPNVTIEVTAHASPSSFAGRWEAEVPGSPRPIGVELAIEGARVTGVFRPNGLPVIDGRVSGDSIRFSVKSPDGARTVTFTGTVRGDQLVLTREIDAPPDRPGGAGLFGVDGPREIVAVRVR